MGKPKYILTRRKALALGTGTLLWPVVGQASPVETITGAAFGTTWRLTLPSSAGLERLRSAIDSAFGEIDLQMSPWRLDGEIGHFNGAEPGTVSVSVDTAHVAASALSLAEISGGKFDPTVGPLVARWGFGPITGSGPNYRGISVDESVLIKHEPGLTLDLCGIAKGWALDRVLGIVRKAGHGSVLMDLGGEVAVLGAHPSGRRWRVLVENPLGGTAPAMMRLVSGQAVATSGMAAQSYSLDGKDYGHIIDPKRGMPASGELKSVTVVKPSAMAADGWATALFAAGAETGPRLAEIHGISALFLVGEDLRQVRTGEIGASLL